MADGYDAQAIEARWQERWATSAPTRSTTTTRAPPVLRPVHVPVPVGPAHMGHVRNYTFGDLLARYRTMNGDGVLSPIGFDSFGLPAENAAIKTGVHPRAFTDARIEELTASLSGIGAVYDWRREVRSHDPEYIRWTQWIFLRLLEAGLAYRDKAPVNWCPGCQTVLANEQVLADGTCERSGDVVEKRDLEQWFFKITDYAAAAARRPRHARLARARQSMQRNWIGRSEGAEFEMPVSRRRATPHPTAWRSRVFTTRPDTSFGMTFCVLAPEHPLVGAITTDDHRARGRGVRRAVRSETRDRPAVGRGSARQARRASPAPTRSTRSPGSRCRSTSPTTCS